MNHTDACIKAQAAYEAMQAAFTAKYPKHCTVCGGVGGKWVQYDPSAAGVSLSPGSMTELDTCLQCFGKCICPICGEHLPPEGDYNTDEDEVCDKCGWRLIDNPIVIPEPHECWCWENEHCWKEGDGENV
jgi:hypothetical protein